jgi:hypothetical protein
MLGASRMRRAIVEHVALVRLALWTGCGEEALKRGTSADMSPDLNGGVGGSAGDAPAGGTTAMAAGAMATAGGASGSPTTAVRSTSRASTPPYAPLPPERAASTT